MKKAVIFDLDGTLLDSLEDLADSVNLTLTRLGYAVHELDKYKYFVGDGVRNLVYRALPQDVRDDEKIFNEALTIQRGNYQRLWDKKTRPYKGIPQLLDELVSRKIEIAVLSNKSHDFTLKVVDKLLAGWKFRFVQGVNEAVLPKPDLIGINKMVSDFGLSKDDILYMGDTSTDMQTAKGAGLYAVGVLWGFRTADELNDNGADVLIDHPHKAIDLL